MKVKIIAGFLCSILKDKLRRIAARLRFHRKIAKAQRSSNPEIQLQLMHYIQNNNHTKIIEIFESGIAVDLPLHREDLKSTPLAVAAYEGHLDLVKLLLERGARINPQDPELMSPLIMATLNNKSEIVKFLLDQGADLEAKDLRCGTALVCAAEMGYTALVKLLLEREAVPSMRTLQAACARGSLECVDLLLQYGAEVNSSNEEGNTPLITASYFGREEIVKKFLEHGADINMANNNKETALFFALGRGYREVSKLLIERGIDLAGTNKFGLSPLLLASTIGDEVVLDLINQKLAELNS